MKRRRKPTAKKKGHVRGGKKLKSSLEAYCYDALRGAKLQFDYEEHKYYLMDGFKYEGVYHKATRGKDIMVDKTGKAVLGVTYTPDFVSEKHKFVIETKGWVPSQHTFTIRWKMFLHHMNDTGKGDWMLFIPRNRKQVDDAINIIKQQLK